MNNYSRIYSHFNYCGNSKVSAKYFVDNLVMCENRVNTHTFSSRVFYRKYLRCQRVSKSVFYDFATFFLRLISTQWCSALPCDGCQSIVLLLRLRRYQSALIVPCLERHFL